MLAFGAGTLPSMLSTGLLGGSVQGVLHSPALRRVLGVMVIGLGLGSPWLAQQGHDHQSGSVPVHQHH